MNGRIILGNAVSLFISNVLVRLVSAAAAILIARYLQVHDFGILSVGLAFSAIAGSFTDLGLTHTLIREGTKPGADHPRLVSSFLRIRLVLALATVGVSAVLIGGLYSDPFLRRILYLTVIPAVFGAALQGVGNIYFQIIQKMKYTALISGISGLITAGALFAGIAFHWRLELIAAVYGFSGLIGGTFSIWMVTRRIPIRHGWDPALLRGLLAFTAGGFVVMFLPQLGPLILEKVAGLQQVGYFAAAFRIPAMLYQVPGILAAAFYPLLFRLGNEQDLPAHLELNTMELKLMSLLGMLMALPFLLYAPWWIATLFGPGWAPVAGVLKVLAMAVVLQSINFPLADALTTTGLQPRRTAVLTLALLWGWAAYYFLGSRYGSQGGGLAALAVEGLLTVGFLLANPNGPRLFTRGLRYNLPVFGLVYLTGMWWGRRLSPWLGIPLTEALFALFVLALDQDLRRRVLALWASFRRPHPDRSAD